MHRYLYLGSVLFFFLIYSPWLYYWARNPEKNHHRLARARRRIARLSSALVGIRYKIRYEQPIDWSGPYIICPNHTSNLDITAMVLACPTDFTFIGKQELLNNPVTGLFFRTIDLPINRESKLSAFRVFKKAEDLLARGRCVLIFPEGTIHNVFPPRLGAFKNGPFRMALETGIPIVPVVIHDAWKLCWDDGKEFGTQPGRVNIEVLSPIRMEKPPGVEKINPEHVHALRDRVFSLIDARWRAGQTPEM